MKRMSGWIALLLCLALFAACGGPAQSGEQGKGMPVQEQEAEVSASDLPPEQANAPEDDEFSDPALAYETYLYYLQDQRERILGYNWQKGFGYDEEYEEFGYRPGTVNVALADVWGSPTPELLYLCAEEPLEGFPPYMAELHVLAYDADALIELYSFNELDAQAGGGMVYRIFTVPDQSGLWLYTHWFSEVNDEEYRHLVEDGNALTVAEDFTHTQHYDYETDLWSLTCTIDGEEVTEEEYRAALPAKAFQARGLLLRNLDYDEYGMNLPTVYPTNGAGMTVDEAIDYLRALLGQDVGENAEDFFGQVPDMVFASGAGGWSTDLQFHADGSVELSFHDSDMGDTGEGYPHGTVYVCSCVLHLGELERLDDYRWTARVVERNMDGPEPGEEWIRDDVRYIQSEPYGLEEADRVYFYLPGTPTTELPREFLRWIAMPRAWNMDEIPQLLPCWGLYSVNDETGFSGE